MKYLLGSKKDFCDFVNLINSNHRIGIITHTDLDGLASAFFLEKILESKQFKVEIIDFVGYEKGMFDFSFNNFKKKKITKVFLTDMNADGGDLESFEKFRKSFDCFLIDHHPLKPGNWNKKNVLKTRTSDCSAWVLYNFAKDYFEVDEWTWLVTATMISEFSFNDKNNLKFLIDKCADITSIEDIDKSQAFFISNTIGASITLYKPNFEKVYNLIKNKDLMIKAIAEYKEDAKFFPKKNIYFGFLREIELISPSQVITRVSKENFSCVFIIAYVPKANPNIIKISSRCQSGKINVNLLMKKGVKGLKDAVFGGHVKASGAIIKKQDLDKFKDNLLK